MKSPPELLLVDNGSLEPAATLSLRRIAKALAAHTGRKVTPLSLLHSHKVPAEQLEGVPAEILEPALKRRLAEGYHCFELLPLFFGPSGAITDYLPQRLEVLRKTWPELEVSVLPFLSELRSSARLDLLELLLDNARLLLDGSGLQQLVLVDHGSPKREVAAVRDALTEKIRLRLGSEVASVTAASMERREGSEYDFNEPLLERALRAFPAGPQALVLLPLFVSPGRHAGPGGDIAGICEAACQAKPGLRVHQARLVGEHPDLPALLASAWTL